MGQKENHYSLVVYIERVIKLKTDMQKTKEQWAKEQRGHVPAHAWMMIYAGEQEVVKLWEL